jgi:hypothetical protein
MILEEASEHRSGRESYALPEAAESSDCLAGVGHFGTLPRQIFRRMRNLGNYAGSRENLIRYIPEVLRPG